MDTPYPLNPVAWPPQQNPFQNQAEDEPHYQSDTTEEEIGSDGTQGSGGGSNNMQEASKKIEVKGKKKLVRWKVKSKLKGIWMPRKKMNTATTPLAIEAQS